MEFRTKVNIEKPVRQINIRDSIACVGSCFADHIGRMLQEHEFRVTVNPRGTMYNPASVWHTVQTLPTVDTLIVTLGTARVYILKESGEIVDNCEKRPAKLFEERDLDISECAAYLEQCVERARHTIITVSPIRYAKYGFHGSQLSKARLLLAADSVCKRHPDRASYFPAYEIFNDELRDYRFYAADMLHPSSQSIDYIWERLSETYFDEETQQWLRELEPIRRALAHRPFNPESEEYKQFRAEAEAKFAALKAKL